LEEELMHDIDRIQLELESDGFEFPEEFEFPEAMEGENLFDEAEEMELAAELLSISNEAELDQFLGNLISKAGQAVGKFVKSPTGRALGGILKGVAKKALPAVGGALGSLIPVPGVGTAVGTALGTAVSKALEVELEGMEPEDQEFEAARRFVRIAGDATKRAAQAPPRANPAAAAQTAVMAAARQHAPMVSSTPMPMTGASGATSGASHSGRWIRRGRKIILFGV
jgi:hypothetical protein